MLKNSESMYSFVVNQELYFMEYAEIASPKQKYYLTFFFLLENLFCIKLKYLKIIILLFL
jgi:hypothetical protein